jgi:nucleotide-binding universal stress UspA family protein
MQRFATILHPTDFSESAFQAFHLATMLAGVHGSQVIVLHVHLPLAPVVAFGEAVVQIESADDQKKLKDALQRFQPSDPAIKVEHQLLIGEPVAEILRVAHTRNCDLIVMGASVRTGVPRLLLGSVAEHVMHKAECPVIAMKIPKGARGNNPFDGAMSSYQVDMALSKYPDKKIDQDLTRQ